MNDHIAVFKDIIRTKLIALNRLRNMVNNDIYICSPPIHNRGVSIMIQVSVNYRSRHGNDIINRRCRRIAMLYEAAYLDGEERMLYNNVLAADYFLSNMNENYVRPFAAIRAELFDIYRSRGTLIGFSHDVNNFYIVIILSNGDVRYRYFF